MSTPIPPLYWSPSLSEVIHLHPATEAPSRWSDREQCWVQLPSIPADSFRLIEGEPVADPDIDNEMADAARLFDRASQILTANGAHLVCQECGDNGFLPAGGFGDEEWDERPCPKGCPVPAWLEAERNDARLHAEEAVRLRDRVRELESQLSGGAQ